MKSNTFEVQAVDEADMEVGSRFRLSLVLNDLKIRKGLSERQTEALVMALTGMFHDYAGIIDRDSKKAYKGRIRTSFGIDPLQQEKVSLYEVDTHHLVLHVRWKVLEEG